jgi:hypothetical protein
MAQQITQKAQQLSLTNGEVKPNLRKRAFGKDMLKEFSFDPEWRNLNHGILEVSLTNLHKHILTF